MQHDAADQLHVEVAHPERAQCRLAHHRERLRQQLIERRAVLQTLLELVGLGAQRLVREGLDVRLELVGRAHVAGEPPQHALVAAPEDMGQGL